MAEEFMKYKGYALVRSGNEICYGNPGDQYVVNISVLSSKNENGIEVSTGLRALLMDTQATDLMKMMVKNAERDNLYEMLDVANVWLTRMANQEA